MRTIRRRTSEADDRVDGPRPDGRLSRGHIALLVAFFAALGVVVLGSVITLPYAVLSPGPTVNTIGDVPGGRKPLIEVSGLPTYPASGHLNFTTVSVAGGPGYPVDVWTVLGAWLDSSKEVLPVDQVFDPKASQKQVAEENAIQMEGSQEEATAVAMRALGHRVPSHVAIAKVLDASKAKGLLKEGDRILTVAGKAASDPDIIRSALQTVKPGASIAIEVSRSGKNISVMAPTITGQEGQTALGVLLRLDHDFPAKVTINAGDVGGPSAGLMFALGIYDRLTPGSLTQGRDIAGTGTIGEQGAVGPIGGIEQKLAGARNDGADYFLAPAANCSEAAGHVPDGLEVFKVQTFADALKTVEGIAAGRTSGLPRC